MQSFNMLYVMAKVNAHHLVMWKVHVTILDMLTVSHFTRITARSYEATSSKVSKKFDICHHCPKLNLCVCVELCLIS